MERFELVEPSSGSNTSWGIRYMTPVFLKAISVKVSIKDGRPSNQQQKPKFLHEAFSLVKKKN